MSFRTDDLREEILEQFVIEHDKINQLRFIYEELQVFHPEAIKKRRNAAKRERRTLNLRRVRLSDRNKKSFWRFTTPDTVLCNSCHEPMMSFITPGHPRTYCSEKCKAKVKNAKRYTKCENQKQAQ